MKRIVSTLAAVVLAGWLWTAQAPAQQPQRPPAGGQPAQGTQAGRPAQQPGQPAKKQPQAKSQEEYDALQKLGDPSLTPDQKISLAEEFLQKFKDSELKGFAYRKEMEAYQQKNDFPKMREFGEKILEEDPDDAISLILLASAIPERTRDTDLDKEQKLSQAEDYAKRALVSIDKLEKPSPQMSDADWDKVRNDARAQSHAAIGLVALQRKQFPAAEEAFKKAVELQNQKDPIVYWRLGLTYEFSKKYEEARDALKQSVALGGVKIGTRDVAAEELQRVEDILKKRQSGPGAGPGTGTTPGTGTPPGGTPRRPGRSSGNCAIANGRLRESTKSAIRRPQPEMKSGPPE